MKKQKKTQKNIKNKKDLKTKQKEILLLIYRYRFLNRIQIQKLLQQTYHNNIVIWLNELTDKNYLIRYYTKSIVSIPALYSLGPLGRKYLRMHAKKYRIHVSLLDRVWHEKNTTYEFKNRLQFVAEIYLSLTALTKKTNATLNFHTAVDLHGIHNLPTSAPDGFFSITEKNGLAKRFFIIILKASLRHVDVAKLVTSYFTYYKKGIWQTHNPHPFPEIIIICPDLKTKSFVSGMIKNKLKKGSNLSFLLTTQQLIRKQGMTKTVLHKVTL